MLKKLLFISFILINLNVFSQGEPDEQKKIFFRNEKTFAFTMNTNGWGINYRYAKRINAAKKWIYDGDFNVIKHQKEKKQFSIYPTAGRFVYGKMNYAFNLRLSMGRQRELYRKFDQRSVSVRIFYTAGATIAFLKPIYYQVISKDQITPIDKKFDPDDAPPVFYIVGKSPIYMGMFETKIIPGGYIKAGLTFEYSKKDKKYRGVDVGFCFDAYPKKLEILAIDNNPMFIPSLFLTYRFGKVVSGYYLKEIDEAEN